jgi:biopolymer transport protein ExbD
VSSGSVAPAWANVELPHATGPGGDRWDERATVITASMTAVVMHDKKLVVIEGGQVASQDRNQLTIDAVTDAIRQLPSAPRRVVVAADRKLPYRILVGVLASAMSAGVSELGVAAQGADGAVAIPVTIPTRAPARSGQGAAPVQTVLEFDNGRLALWSFSGLEGSASQPLRTFARSPAGVVELVDALEALVGRRFAADRHPDDRAIIVMPDVASTVDEVVGTLSYLRRTAKGRELFPRDSADRID